LPENVGEAGGRSMSEVTKPVYLGEWCVFEWRTGTPWEVTPATGINAHREAEICGQGFTAFPVETAKLLQNAWAHGRMYEVERARGDA
jgi:hypothetical protein